MISSDFITQNVLRKVDKKKYSQGTDTAATTVAIRMPVKIPLHILTILNLK